MSVEASHPLERARTAYARRQWADALSLLKQADHLSPLGVEDLDRLAWSAGMRDCDADLFAALERLYTTYLDAGNLEMAARAAFFFGYRVAALGELGRASAWLQRAQNLVSRCGRECATSGYLLLPAIR